MVDEMKAQLKRQHAEFQEIQQAFHKQRDDDIAERNGRALCEAILKGVDVDIYKLMNHTRLINYGARDHSGMTPLHHAARSLNTQLVFDLVERAPDSADAIT